MKWGELMSDLFASAQIPFMGATSGLTFDAADAVLFGAPHGTPYLNIDNEPHAATPHTLRRALQEDARWLDHWDFDLGGPLLGDGDFKLADAGNLITTPLDGPGNRASISAATSQILDASAIPLMIGGDDSTPIPFIEALKPAGPLTIIQIDAHIDWRQERRGEPLGYSSTMRRASEFAHVEAIIQVGMRGLGSARREEVEIARDWGARIVTARDVHRDGIDAVMAHVPDQTNCMITLDCDALDPGIMPAVMAPTPGGLTYTHSIDLIAAVIGKANLVAFDMIEFVPERDPDGTAAITAARIIANTIGCLARR